jgi:hypothetical protein
VQEFEVWHVSARVQGKGLRCSMSVQVFRGKGLRHSMSVQGFRARVEVWHISAGVHCKGLGCGMAVYEGSMQGFEAQECL